MMSSFLALPSSHSTLVGLYVPLSVASSRCSPPSRKFRFGGVDSRFDLLALLLLALPSPPSFG